MESGNTNIIAFDPEQATKLRSVLAGQPGLVVEAHSIGYQGAAPLAQLVRDGFSILKVGPEFTFALLEAL